jgi:hypothetical protein
MSPWKPLTVSLAAFIILFLTACGQTAVSDAVEPMLPTQPPPTATEIPTPEPADTARTELVEVAVVEAVDECAACHLDRERIIANLAPEEEVIKESEGVG